MNKETIFRIYLTNPKIKAVVKLLAKKPHLDRR